MVAGTIPRANKVCKDIYTKCSWCKLLWCNDHRQPLRLWPWAERLTLCQAAPTTLLEVSLSLSSVHQAQCGLISTAPAPGTRCPNTRAWTEYCSTSNFRWGDKNQKMSEIKSLLNLLGTERQVLMWKAQVFLAKLISRGWEMLLSKMVGSLLTVLGAASDSPAHRLHL